jgi:hypothetical protein
MHYNEPPHPSSPPPLAATIVYLLVTDYPTPPVAAQTRWMTTGVLRFPAVS